MNMFVFVHVCVVVVDGNLKRDVVSEKCLFFIIIIMIIGEILANNGNG